MDDPAYVRRYGAFEHPNCAQAVSDLVKQAILAGHKVRVRGAMHSERGSVLPLRQGEVVLMLDQLIDFHFDEPSMTVTAGAGISLGGDPFAPRPAHGTNPQRDPAKSLFKQLDDLGYALPVTGGISHQTLSGFISTGAAGGSLEHSFLDAVQELTLVDGRGCIKTLTRADPDFDAALVSLGLFGVLVQVKLKCEPRYRIAGLRSIQRVTAGDFSLVPEGDGKPSLVDFLTAKEYARVLWWAEPGVERFELWEAARLERTDYPPIAQEQRVPRQAVGVPGPALQIVARLIFSVLSRAKSWQKLEQVAMDVRSLLENDAESLTDGVQELVTTALSLQVFAEPTLHGLSRPTKKLIAALREQNDRDAYVYPASAGRAAKVPSEFGKLRWSERVIAPLFRAFEPLSDRAVGTEADGSWKDVNEFKRKYVGQLFLDDWYSGLPMDNPISDRLLPTTFTEIWLPLRNAEAALRALRAMLLKTRLKGTGTYAIELYVAKACTAWLSATGGEDVLRVDPFWFDDGNDRGREAFFSRFWETLRPFEMRLHWAKALPRAVDGHDGEVAYREQMFPRLAAFRELRKAYDPQDTFLVDYWRTRLGID